MTAPFDALVPTEMARKAETTGVSKVALSTRATFGLAVLAGAFIALGAVFATTVTSDPGLSFGVSRFLGGLAFSLGLILVVVGGAELFTGNNLIVMAWASRRVSTAGILRNWAIVYVGNLVGAVGTAALVVASGHHEIGGGLVGDNALAIAQTKQGLDWVDAFVRGVLANGLVCLAVWLSMSARSVTDRILAVVFPITAFVAAGFEHSIANMYFVPVALLLKADTGADFWTVSASSPEEYESLSWGAFVVDNLIPVSLGNIVGGAGLVALVYWVIYLKGAADG